MKEIILREFEKAKEIACVFEDYGYQVFIEPTKEQVPFDLGNYRPDLVAVKGEGGVVVEIIATLKRLPTKMFDEISQIIAAKPGWKFALVTLDDDVNNIVSVVETDLPNPAELKKKLNDINTLRQMGMLSNALVFLWIQLESWLRIKSSSSDDKLNLLQPKRLINHLYTDGELSIEQVNILNELMQLRNKAIHGFDVTITEQELEEGLKLLQEIIDSVDGANKEFKRDS